MGHLALRGYARSKGVGPPSVGAPGAEAPAGGGGGGTVFQVITPRPLIASLFLLISLNSFDIWSLL